MKVLFVFDTKTPFESIQLLQEMIRDSLSGHVDLTVLDAGSTSVDGYEDLLKSQDVIIGTDANLFLARRRMDSSCPILLPSYGMATRGLLQIWEWREGLQQGDAFICSSTADLAGVATHLRDDQIRLLFAPFPLPEAYSQSETSHMDISGVLSRFGINAGSHTSWMLCAGRLNQQKNVHLSLRVVHALAQMGRSVGLLIVGKEDASGFPELGWDNKGYEQDLRNLSEELQIQGHVHFLDTVDRQTMRDLYRSVDVNLTCSTFRTEDFGLVPVEAMTYGVPTVGTAWGGFWDTIQDGLTGYHVPVHMTSSGFRVDWLAAAHRVDRILSDSNLRAYFDRNCRTYVRTNFSQPLFRERLIDAMVVMVKERTDHFRPLKLESLVDEDTASFFKDLRERTIKLGSLFAARKGLYAANNGAYVRAFFSEYARSQSVGWNKDSIVYIPLPLSFDGNTTTTLDRNWHGTVTLTDQELRLVSQLSGEGKSLLELTSLLGITFLEVIDLCESMMNKGVIIPLDRSVR